METKFKVGDVVYDSLNAPNEQGSIVDIKELGFGTIVVQFQKGTSTYNGWQIKLLSFTPYELKGFTQERPWQPKEGEWVAVEIKETFWYIVRFSHKNEFGNFIDTENHVHKSIKPLTDFITENNKLK